MNRLAAGVVFEVSLSDVRHLLATINQYAVPGLVFGRSRLGDGVIPIFTAGKERINVDNDSTIVEKPMVDGLADREGRFGSHQGRQILCGSL